MLQPVKPRPSAWESRCEACGRYLLSENARCFCCPTVPDDDDYEGPFPAAERVALWGHEWAAVAWMAASQLAVDLLIEQAKEATVHLRTAAAREILRAEFSR